MMKKFLSIALITSFLLSNVSMAFDSPDDLDYEEGHTYITDMLLVEDDGVITLWGSYEDGCNCNPEKGCRKGAKSPEEEHTFSPPTIELNFINKLPDTSTGEEIYWFEQGLELVAGEDYEVIADHGEGSKEHLIYDEYELREKKNSYTDYSRHFEYLSYIEESFKLDGEEYDKESNIIFNELGEHTLTLEGIDYIEATYSYERNNVRYTTRGDPVENKYVSTPSIKKNNSGEVSIEKKVRVGPYPTVYYTVSLDDDNQYTNNKDKITIKNAKMICTYEPEKVYFELCNDNSSDAIRTFEFSCDNKERKEFGWEVDLGDFEENLGFDVEPLKGYYIRVLVDDGRAGTPDTTSSSAPKYAKYDVF